jgi:hypothetical protein
MFEGTAGWALISRGIATKAAAVKSTTSQRADMAPL